MKYYIYRFNRNSGFVFKRTKCSDYWTHNYRLCWEFSKQGAKKIVDLLNDRRRNDLYEYGKIEVEKAEEMLLGYERAEDRATYIAEEMSYRPSGI